MYDRRFGSVEDLVGDVRPRVGEPRRDAEKASICAVKSRRRFVVSFSLREQRGVGDGERSKRRTVEGVIWVRARGVAWNHVSMPTLHGGMNADPHLVE